MLNLIETRGFSNPKNARNFALLNVAMYDATIAAWDSKYTYNRVRPSIADPSIQTAMEVPRSPSYPSEHAATAGAAAEILAYLYPGRLRIFAGSARRLRARH
jgi:membrane-associated phospholipid phosphatase